MHSIVSDDNSEPAKLPNVDCTTSRSLEFVNTVTSDVPKTLVDSSNNDLMRFA